MSELGQWLQETRQAKKLSLEQVEAETRIRALFLAALEKEEYDELPAEIYVKGFLRNYALFLGLDPKEVMEKYEQRDANRQDGEPGLFRPLEVTLFRPTAERLRNWLLLLILVAGPLTVGLWAWKTGRLAWSPPLALFQRTATTTLSPTRTLVVSTAEPLTRSPQPSATATVQAVATHTPRPTSTTGVLIAPTSTSSPTPTVTMTRVTVEPTKENTEDIGESPTPTTTLVSLPRLGVTLAVTITESNWVEVTVDGRNAFRGLMEPGEQGAWEARREIILRLGNAGGAEVTVNGEFLGALGERQQVIEFAWGPEGELTPEPTFTPEPTTEIETTPIGQ